MQGVFSNISGPDTFKTCVIHVLQVFKIQHCFKSMFISLPRYLHLYVRGIA